MLSRFHTIPACHGQTDRRTDGQTDRIAISIKTTWQHFLTLESHDITRKSLEKLLNMKQSRQAWRSYNYSYFITFGAWYIYLLIYLLRSADVWTCVVRQTRIQFGDRSFAVAGPRVWNSLPAPLRDTNSIYSFRQQLKTFLFSGGCRA